MNKKNHFTNILHSILISSLMLCSSVVAAAKAPAIEKEDIFTYVVEDGSATITNVDDIGKVITVPETLGGAPVTTLAGGAFGGCVNIQEVLLPDSITSIGSMCFSYCTELTNVALPKHLKRIENGVFNHCTKLRNITIPNSVEIIEKDAFYRCDELWTITIPDGVTTIGDSAFAACPNLSAATIPESVTSIGDRAFEKAGGFRIYAKPDSYAANFASANNIPFEEYITVSVNGTEIAFDQPPVTDKENFRTLVPMRAVLDVLGAEISWDNQTETAKIVLPHHRILIRINEPYMMVNGEMQTLSSPAIEYNLRTLLPIRDIIEAIQGTVHWNEDQKHIDIFVNVSEPD